MGKKKLKLNFWYLRARKLNIYTLLFNINIEPLQLCTGKRQHQYDGVIQLHILPPVWQSEVLIPVPEGWQGIWMGKNGDVPNKTEWLCVSGLSMAWIFYLCFWVCKSKGKATLGRTNEQFGGSWTCNSSSNSRWQLWSGSLLPRFIGCTWWTFSSGTPWTRTIFSLQFTL